MFTHLYPYLRTLLCVRYSLLSTFSFYWKYSGNRSGATITATFICICSNLVDLCCCCCVSDESGATGGYTHRCSTTENNPYLVLLFQHIIRYLSCLHFNLVCHQCFLPLSPTLPSPHPDTPLLLHVFPPLVVFDVCCVL